MTNDDGLNPQDQDPQQYPQGQGAPGPDPAPQWGQQPPQYGGQQPPQPPQYGSAQDAPGVPPAQPYQQPYQGQPGYAQAQQQYSQGGPGDFAPGTQPIAGIGQEPKKSHKKLIIGIVIAVVAVIVIIALIVVFAVVGAVRSQKKEEEAAAQAKEDWKTSITAPVEGYLDALADGDAKKALTFVDKDTLGEPSDLMTDDVLAASVKKAPIKDIDVPAVDPAYDEAPFDVPATFTMADKKVSLTFTVEGPSKPEEGETPSDDPFTIDVTPGTVTMPDELAAAGASINGAKVKAGDYTILPGAYTFSLPNKNLSMDGDATSVFTGDDISSAYPTLKLSDDGKKAAKDAVSDAVDTCVASKKLKAGCGLDIPKKLDDGTKVKDGTVKRSLDGSAKKAVKNADVTLDYDDPSQASVSIYTTVKTEVDSDKGKGTVTGSSNYLDKATVDISGDKVKVTSWDD
jgi:hypothetical protein